MTTCAVYKLDTGLIINLIVAEPTDLCPYQDCGLVDTAGYIVAIAYTWNGVNFVDYFGNVVLPIPAEPELEAQADAVFEPTTVEPTEEQ